MPVATVVFHCPIKQRSPADSAKGTLIRAQCGSRKTHRGGCKPLEPPPTHPQRLPNLGIMWCSPKIKLNSKDTGAHRDSNFLTYQSCTILFKNTLSNEHVLVKSHPTTIGKTTWVGENKL